MNAKRKRLPQKVRWIIILIILGIAVAGYVGVSALYNSLPKSLGTRNSRIEVCETLGIDPEKEPNCQDGTPLIPLLERVFPPGAATRQQVREALGDYYMDTSVYMPGGNNDYYWYNSPLFSFWPEYVIFLFDQEDVLISISGG